MRKSAYLLALWALLSLAYCSEETEIENTGESSPSNSPYAPGVELTVKASVGDGGESRTVVVDATRILWTKDDAINLYYGSGSAGKFTSVNISDPTSYAEFTGTLTVVTGSNETGTGSRSFWAAYPYNPANTCDGSSVTLTIPSVQESAPDTFADNLNPTVATGPGLDLVFYNVGSWLRFSVAQEGITSATLRGNNNEDLVGKVKVTMDSDQRPACTVLEGGKSITMEAPEGGFVPGKFYYMVLIPQTLTQGYTLTLFKGNASGDCVVSNSALFSRSSGRRKENADNGLVFNGIINFQDPAVKAICVANWDTDEDGELSYSEAAAVTTIPSGLFSDNTDISTFNELQYFTGLTIIKSQAFMGCSSLESIIFPEHLETIEGRAFSGCLLLKEVVIPSSVTTMLSGGGNYYYGAFYESGVEKIECDDTLLSFSGIVASGLSKLGMAFCYAYTNGGNWATLKGSSREQVKEIIINKHSLTYVLPSDSFAYFSGMESITLPLGLTQIGDRAFFKCSNLLSISVGTELISIGEQAFSYCDHLSTLNLPDCVETMGSQAFRRCEGLSSFVIPNSVTTIESGLFRECSGLISIDIPDNVTSIKSEAFYECSVLSSLELPESVETIGDNAFGYCIALTDIILPKNLISIGNYAFYCCINLTSVSIPEGLISIGEYSFVGCRKLVTCTIPSSITSIGSYAFGRYYDIMIPGIGAVCGDCPCMQSLYISAINPPTIGDYSFAYCNGCPIYVPAGSVETYRTTEGWSAYADRIQCDPSQVVHLEGVSLIPTLTMAKGSTTTLTPTFTPSDASYKSVTWSSSDESVATVAADGTVTAIDNGTATITVITEDGGYTANCSVTVNTSGKTFPEGNIFDEDAYITYVANHQGWFIISNDASYRYDTFFPGVSGTRIEMKFRIPDFSSWNKKTELASGDNGFGSDASNVYFWERSSHGHDGYTYNYTNLTDGGVDGSGIILLSAECNGTQISTSVNGMEKTFSSTLSSFDLDYLFSSYDIESDDGTLEEYVAGVPDGSQLYYVKIWDGNSLVYNGYASRAINPANSTEEYCWFVETNGNHIFAYDNTYYPSNCISLETPNPIRQPFGGGID